MSYEKELEYYIEEMKPSWNWERREIFLEALKEMPEDIKYTEEEYQARLAEFMPWKYRKASQKAVRYCFVLIKKLDLNKDQAKECFGNFTHANNEEMTMIIAAMEKEAGVTLSEFKAESNDLAWTRRYGFNFIGESMALCFDCIHCKVEKTTRKGSCSKKIKMGSLEPSERYPYFENCFESKYGRLQE